MLKMLKTLRLIHCFIATNLFRVMKCDRCRHGFANSLRLLRLHRCFLQIIIFFSARHKLPFLLRLLYDLHFLRIFHLILNVLLASFILLI